MQKYTDLEVKKTEILIDVIAKETGINILRTPKKRHRNLADSRAVFMYLCRKNTIYSLADIGLLFKTSDYKGKDHATILHQSNKIKNFLEVGEVSLSNLVRRCQESFDKICVEKNIPKISSKKPKNQQNLVRFRRYQSYSLHVKITMRGRLNCGFYV